MTKDIESGKVVLKEVFDKWYRIPEYQRPYVWDVDQVTELLEDIAQACAANPDAQYFLGSMVLRKNYKRDGNISYEEYELLDGQQRVTTLFLIMTVIRDLTSESNSSRLKICVESIYKMANPDDDEPERMRIIFDIRDRVKKFVSDFIKETNGTKRIQELAELSEDKNEDISVRNMSKAIITISDYFNKNSNIIDSFFKFLRTKVLMIYVATEELQDAFHLFTVMNNRGVKLRNSDILKAENLKEISSQSERTDYAKKWENIEQYFGEDFDIFLSHLRTILVKQKAGYNLLKEFNDNIYSPREFDRATKTYQSKEPLLRRGKNTFDFIENYFDYYNELFEKDHYNINQSYELKNYLTLMRKGFEADYWIAALLHFYSKFKTNNLIEFVRKLDKKFSADWIVGVSPTARIENVNAIIQQIDSSSHVDDVIKSPTLNINFVDFQKFIQVGLYGRRYARYLLLKLDLLYHGNSTKFDPPDKISIEHILPQNPRENSQWLVDFLDNDRKEWTDKIGNLTLISRQKNAAQSNLDYDQKKVKYFKGNVELFSNSVRIYNQYSTWGMADLIDNHNKVAEKLKHYYQ